MDDRSTYGWSRSDLTSIFSNMLSSFIATIGTLYLATKLKATEI